MRYTYSLEIVKKDGKVRYDIYGPTHDALEKVQKYQDTMIQRAKTSPYFPSYKNIEKVNVTLQETF